MWRGLARSRQSLATDFLFIGGVGISTGTIWLWFWFAPFRVFLAAFHLVRNLGCFWSAARAAQLGAKLRIRNAVLFFYYGGKIRPSVLPRRKFTAYAATMQWAPIQLTASLRDSFSTRHHITHAPGGC